MKQRIALFVLTGILLSSFAQAQHSGNSPMAGMHAQHKGMKMPSMHMGMSGMEALKGLSGKKFNIAFMSQMIAHHQGAVEMAQQVLKVAKHAETKKEASMVIADQKKEIKQMTGWLQTWYGVKPSQKQANLMKSDMKSMMGMKIKTDRMFFEMMMSHHQGAIEMSQLVPKQSDKAELKQLARTIIKAQKAEIVRYKGLLNHVG
ncbi:MAG: DUF305 domain-containing protein [Chthonomonadaceae bacterium]|nr:DUF305 domain-containing protein [Chthonomonadaceae bacterium]